MSETLAALPRAEQSSGLAIKPRRDLNNAIEREIPADLEIAPSNRRQAYFTVREQIFIASRRQGLSD
jgi:hypothetical protein